MHTPLAVPPPCDVADTRGIETVLRTTATTVAASAVTCLQQPLQLRVLQVLAWKTSLQPAPPLLMLLL
jgi:hypothetical protein